MKSRTALLALILILIVQATLLASKASATMSPTENVNLYTGNRLVVRSDQSSIRTVVIRGNLSAATITTTSYPAKNFTIATNQTELYTLNVFLSLPSSFTAFIETRDPRASSSSQVTSYYVSSGDLNLTIYASFQPGPGSGATGPLGFNSFYDWLGQFGSAFPFWIKILYGLLAVQFAFVGQRWIRFEDDRRRLDSHLPPLDRGNKVYLWTDIIFRALVAGFAISLVIMLGEVFVILISQYLLFVNLSLFPLLDFFSLFFVAILAGLLYLAREGLDRFLDLKPMVED